MYVDNELKTTTRGLLFFCRSFWMNSASLEYKNISANKGAHSVPMGIQLPVGKCDYQRLQKCCLWGTLIFL
jgi:hypothetical protein